MRSARLNASNVVGNLPTRKAGLKGSAMKSLFHRLQAIHSALDDALGDSDIDFLSMPALRREFPVQWAATKLALVMADLEKRVNSRNSQPTEQSMPCAGCGKKVYLSKLAIVHCGDCSD